MLCGPFFFVFVDNQQNVHFFDRQAIKGKLATRPFRKRKYTKENKMMAETINGNLSLRI